MNRKAIVIGATGVVGREVVKLLIRSEQFSEVVTLTRQKFESNSTKVINYVIDFNNIDKYKDLIDGEFFFSCLGTTKRAAGSVGAQRLVDFDYQFQFAKIAATNGVHHYSLVSSFGADINSFSSYLQMKGDLDTQVKSLDFASVNIFKPSLIVGYRAGFRFFESFAILLLGLVEFVPWFRRYRRITGKELAKKILYEALNDPKGNREHLLDELFQKEKL